jgi:glycosyltransferase involved in cell wall biosynthesis
MSVVKSALICETLLVAYPESKVVIVHDYLTQRGGAERVVLDLLRAFPNARLVTSCWEPSKTYSEFADYDIQTLWTNRIRAFRRDPRRAFAFLAKAFSRHTIADADVVLCSSSGWSHRVTTSAPKIVYCHNPARWLYQPQDYLAGMRPWLRSRFIDWTVGLRRSDAAAAREATRYIVNSTAVAGRVHNAYGIDATVVAPPRGLSPEGPHVAAAGIEPGFFLTVGRARGYKNTDVVCEALASMAGERLVVVGGLPAGSWPDKITGLTGVTDEQMRWLYSNSAGLVAVAHEDFGLSPVEAQAFGIPSVVLRAGGYLDSTVEHVTGVYVDEPTPVAVVEGIVALRARSWSPSAMRRYGRRYAPETFAERLQTIVEDVLSPPNDVFSKPAALAYRGPG